MASIPVFDRTGKEVGTYEVEPTDFAPRINRQLLHDVVVMYQANQRQGTAASKTRSQVAGSTKKMYRQKGTGNARAGSRRSGVRRGGGHIHAKSPRDWSYRLPRKAVQLATRMAVASKVRDNEVVLIDDLKFEQPKTKDMATILNALGCGADTLLVATEGHDVNVYRSARNISGVTVFPISDLNALCVLTPRKMLLTRGAMDALKAKAAEVQSKKTA